MKKLIYLLLLLPLGFFNSCDEFLDVSSKQEMLQDETFESQNGVHMYVNGVYRLLSETSLYGRELTWGLASVLGNNYNSTSSSNLGTNYYNASRYTWEYSGVQTIMTNIWAKGYNVIANCNNIIQEISKKDTSFFEFGSMEKNMILGEMYGIRAMMHFDLLRLFAPAPVTNPTGLAMPYVTTYPDHQPEHKSVNDVLASIIADMEKAKGILAPVDTIFCLSWNQSTSGRIYQSSSYSSAPPNDFVSYRGMRMNYMAATGLLARMYLYKGDYDKAYERALEALEFVDAGWYSWTSSSYQYSSNAASQYPKRFDELLLCFSNNNSYDNWEAYTTGSYAKCFVMNANYLASLFKGDEDDYRLRGMYGTNGVTGRYNNNKRWLVWERPQSTSSSVSASVSDQGPLLPLLRFSELYHIQLECMFLHRNERREAIELLNTMRAKRGCKLKIEQETTKEVLLEILYNDIIRETLTEGQTFFMFKRLNRDIYNGATNIEMKPENWYAPLPDGETSYL